jgi:Flp pilus assembly protein CpaB
VAIPISAVALPAYSEVRLGHLVDPSSGSIAVVHLAEDALLEDTIRDPEQILGRVLAADKPPGLVFSRSDFLPEGTRPGLVAGIPSGKRALRIDAAHVSGLVGLNRGDRFDLVESRSLARTGGAGGRSLPPVSAAAIARVVVENGSVVLPLATRSAPGNTAALQEMVIAVTPEEVKRLTEAFASGARLDCVPRSGRPDEPRAAGTATADTTSVVETISGSERRSVAVPSVPRAR